MKAYGKLPKGASASAAQKSISIWKLLAQLLKKHLRQEQEARQRCLQDCSEKSVHDLRVKTRQLQACLDFLGALASFPALAKMRRALKRQMNVSSSLRDMQAQWRLMAQIRGAGSELKAFRRHLQPGERQRARILKQELKKNKLRKHLAALKQSLLALPKTKRADRQVGALLDRMLAKKFAKMVKLQRHAMTGPGRLHRARIALKKFRYMAKLLQPILGTTNAAELERLHRCQAMMGDIRDLHLLLARLTELAARKPGRWPETAYASLSRHHSVLQRSYPAVANKCFGKLRALSRMRTSLSHLKGGGRRSPRQL